MIRLVLPILLTTAAFADGPGVIVSVRSAVDVAPIANPADEFWRDVKGVLAANDPFSKPVAGHTTEIRSRWTDHNLYLLFICPYSKVNLKPNAITDKETNRLWDFDVAEAFIGADPKHIRRYKEFEVSPQGEWVDLDIDRDHPLPEGGWLWNSGFQVTARVDMSGKIWYGAMKIPYASIDSRPAAEGNELRVNFYRIQGPAPDRNFIAWQPTNARSYHVPEAFGHMRLGPAKAR